MRIGIIKDLNSQPLTFGFIQSKRYKIIENTPAVLKDLLLQKKLDIALISSIECIRNLKQLSWCEKVGVCSYKRVRSILFFQKRFEKQNYIFTDKGSRSSVALLRVLLNLEKKNKTQLIPESPQWIKTKIERGEGSHLIFGDNAFFINYPKNCYEVRDLCKWWYEKTKLSFIFAFWAYHKENYFDDFLFIDSLKEGLKNIEKILNQEKRLQLELKREYLTENLHYFVNEKDLEGFQLFIKKCVEFNLI